MGISITCVVLSTFAQHNYFTSALQVKYTPSGILQKADHKTGYRKPQKTALKMSADDQVFPINSSNHPNLHPSVFLEHKGKIRAHQTFTNDKK